MTSKLSFSWMDNEKPFCIFKWKKAKLTDSEYMRLKWENASFDSPFTKLKNPLESSFEPNTFFLKNNIGYDHTPYYEASTRNMQKNSSIIKSAQTKLRSMKESKGSKRFEHTIKITNMMMLQTKWRKQREKAQLRHRGVWWTILQINLTDTKVWK